MRNIFLKISYDGTRYKGWQRLGDSDNTIQGKLEDVLRKMTEEPNLEVIGSGRTDAGVHALAQAANFHTNSEMSCKEILDYLNKYLPKDISVFQVKDVDERFHARLNAEGKTYKYRIWNSGIANPFENRYALQVLEPLNLDLMKNASRYLIGQHDFTSFTTLKNKKKSMIRTIYNIDFEKEGNMLEITYKGNGFLYNMVRIISGTLIEVGNGNMQPEKVYEMLEKKDRSLAGPTVPGRGLFLVDVEYRNRL